MTYEDDRPVENIKLREFSGITREIWERGEQIEEQMWEDLRRYNQQKKESKSE